MDKWIDFFAPFFAHRAVAARHRLTVRDLDMALWQYSNEDQRD